MVVSVSGITLEKRPARTAGMGAWAEALGLSALTAQLLDARAPAWVRSQADLARYLGGSETESLPKYFELQDMHEATAVIAESLQADERIAVYGDYDADGNTSSNIIAQTIEQMSGVKPHHYIPWRSEGYGLSIHGIQSILDRNETLPEAERVRTLVVVDCGTTSVAEVAFAKAHGLKVVIFDHHRPRPQDPLPNCPLVNPSRLDDPYPHKGICAAGLAYIFARDLNIRLRQLGRYDLAKRFNRKPLLVAAAIGTVADVMGLDAPVNRFLVAEGLKEINSRAYPGMNALMDIYGLKQVTAEDIAFRIGPLFNAAGRIGQPDLGFRLLTARTEEEGVAIAKRMVAANRERIQLTERTYAQALVKAEAVLAKHPDVKFLMVEDARWEKGIIGIVASRLKERFGLPVAVGAGPNAQGRITYSVRSVPGTDFFAQALNPLLQAGDPGMFGGGGHAMAAGMSLHDKARKRLRTAMDAGLRKAVKKAKNDERLYWDVETTLDELSVESVTAMHASLGPTGQSAPPPRVLVRDVQIKRLIHMGSNGQDFSLSLGYADGPGVLKGGLAFRAQGTALGKILDAPDRFRHTLDLVLEPKIHRDARGFEVVQYYIVDAMPPKELFRPKVKQRSRIQEALEEGQRREMEVDKAAKIVWRTIRGLDDPFDAEAQEALAVLHKHNVCAYDTETGGRRAGSKERTQAVTQLAAVKVGKTPEGTYFPIVGEWAMTPQSKAYFAYEYAKRQGKGFTYHSGLLEHGLDPQALDITKYDPERVTPTGEISAIRIGDKLLETPRPFYESGLAMLRFFEGTTPYAYNNPFDAQVMARHWELTAEKPSFGHIRSLHRHGDHYVREAEAEYDRLHGAPMRAAMKENAALMEMFTDPAQWHCAMFGMLVDKGEAKKNRLDQAARRYHVADFNRDDSQHDALEDVGPLMYIAADQICAFGGPKSMVGLWQVILSRIDPRIEVDTYTHDFVKNVKGDPESVKGQIRIRVPEDLLGDPRVKQTLDLLSSLGAVRGFNRRATNLVLSRQYVAPLLPEQRTDTATGLMHFGPFPSLQPVTPTAQISPQSGLCEIAPAPPSTPWHQRIDPATGVAVFEPKAQWVVKDVPAAPARVLETTGGYHEVTLLSKSSNDNSTIYFLRTMKTFLCCQAMLESGRRAMELRRYPAILDVKFYDSSSKVDVTLMMQDGRTRRIEGVPMGSLRRSKDFILDINRASQLPEHLEALKFLDELQFAGIATLTEQGIEVKGVQRDFGDLTIALPPRGQSLSAFLRDHRDELENLLKMASIPLVRSTYVSEEEIEEERETRTRPEAALRIRNRITFAPNPRVEMELSRSLLSVVGRYLTPPQEFAPGRTYLSGVHCEPGTETETLRLSGNLEAFQEIGPTIRNAAWLVYRLQTLPSVRASKTTLDEETQILHLRCAPVPREEDLWVLTRAHVPFTATRDGIEIDLKPLLLNPHHWYGIVSKELGFVKTNERATNRQPAPPGLHDAAKALAENRIDSLRTSRDDQAWVAFNGMRDVAVDIQSRPYLDEKRIERGVERVGRLLWPVASFQHPTLTHAAPHKPARPTADAFDLSEKPASRQPLRLCEITRQTPPNVAHLLADAMGHFQPRAGVFTELPDGRMRLHPPDYAELGQHFKELSGTYRRQLAANAISVRINPLLDGLRALADDPDLPMPHHLPPKDKAAKLTALHRRFAALTEPMERMRHEAYDIWEIFSNTRTQDLAFKEVALLDHLGTELAKHPGNQARTDVMRQYFERLSMAEFQKYTMQQDLLTRDETKGRTDEDNPDRGEKIDRERIKNGTISALDNALTFLTGKRPEPRRNAPHQPGDAGMPPVPLPPPDYAALGPQALHNAYLDFQNTFGKVWETGKKLHRTLLFSDEIAGTGVQLGDPEGLDRLREAAKHLRGAGQAQLLDRLRYLQHQGVIEQLQVEGGDIFFRPTPALIQNPTRHARLLAGLPEHRSYLTAETAEHLPLLPNARALWSLMAMTPSTLVPDAEPWLPRLLNRLQKAGHAPMIFTDAVLQTFLAMPVPLKPGDIFAKTPDGQWGEVILHPPHTGKKGPWKDRTEFLHVWKARTDFLRAALNAGAQSATTPVAAAYYDALRGDAVLQTAWRACFPDRAPLPEQDDAALKGCLLAWQEGKAPKEFMKAVVRTERQRNIDTLSIAQELQRMRHESPQDFPVVLYEGEGVRYDLLQQTNEVDQNIYHGGKRGPRSIQRQTEAAFDHSLVAALRTGAMVSVRSFVRTAANRLARDHGYLLHPEESDNLDHPVAQALDRGDGGLKHPRIRYDAQVSQTFDQLGAKDSNWDAAILWNRLPPDALRQEIESYARDRRAPVAEELVRIDRLLAPKEKAERRAAPEWERKLPHLFRLVTLRPKLAAAEIARHVPTADRTRLESLLDERAAGLGWEASDWAARKAQILASLPTKAEAPAAAPER